MCLITKTSKHILHSVYTVLTVVHNLHNAIHDTTPQDETGCTAAVYVVAGCQCSTDAYAYTHNSDSYRLPVGLLLLIESLL